jgi:hypothetical protein
MGVGRDALHIGPELFNGIENYLRWAEGVPGRLRVGMDVLVRFMAYVNMGYAQRYAAGPVDPRQQRPELAWKLPVRRITGRYFFGWKVRRMGLGIWQLYNDSREAFYIEFGIHRNPVTGQPAARRQRRPIQKLSLLRTVKFLEATEVYNRVWASVVMPPPGQRVGRGFTWQLQSPMVMTQGIHPIGRLPG